MKGGQLTDEWNIDNLPAFRVSLAVLAGRNFQHYTFAVRDPVQPCRFCFADLEIQGEADEIDGETELEPGLESTDDFPVDWGTPDEPEKDGTANLSDLLPDDCWVKRYADDYSTDTCRLVYLVMGPEGDITDSGCLREDARRCSGGGKWLGVPGMELPLEKAYSYTAEVPEKIFADLRKLFAGQALPLDFVFTGRFLPQKLKNRMKPGEHQCIFALPSALRQAFSHMTVDLDEQDSIRSLTLSTWQRSGSSFGDLFYQPMSLADRQEEVMNALLYLYDSYTDEERQWIGSIH